MRFSLQARYAITGIFDLAYNGHGEAVQVRVIGERQGIPPRYLEQIFQRLRRAGLLAGKRGPGGGYRLVPAPGQIDLLQIVEAVEGPLDPFAHETDGAAPDRPDGEGAEPRPESERTAGEYGPDFLWNELTGQLADVLAAVTIEDLCRRAAHDAVPRAEVAGYEYQI